MINKTMMIRMEDRIMKEETWSRMINLQILSCTPKEDIEERRWSMEDEVNEKLSR